MKHSRLLIEFMDLPASLSNLPNVVDRRTRPLFLSWASLPDMDLRRLIHAIYLQGVWDGVKATEKEQVEPK